MRGVGRRLTGSVRRNPFTSGMLAGSATESLLRATKRRKKTVRRALRPPARAPARVKPSGSYMVGKLGKFRKGRKPRVYKHAVKRNYDDYGTITKTHGLWCGFQHHASTSRLWECAGEALLKAILATIKQYPTNYDENYLPHVASGGDHIANKIMIQFKRITQTGGAEDYLTQDFLMHDATGLCKPFKDLAKEIGDNLRAYQEANIAVAPQSDVVGYFPYRFTVFRKGDSNVEVPLIENRALDDAVLELAVSQRIVLQNVTPNDDGTAALDVNGTNPLKGKFYQFTGAPRVRSEIVRTYDATYDVADLQKGYQSTTTGCLFLADQPVDSPLGHPPAATQFFENCKKTAPCTIPSGGRKSLTTTFRFRGTYEQLAKKHGFTGYDRVTIGGVTWFGFEQAMRQGQDTIKLGFNREVHMTARCQLKPKKVMLSHYDQTDLGDVL